MNNKHRVTKLVALLVLFVIGCGSKETAEPPKVGSKQEKAERPEKGERKLGEGAGQGAAADCVKAKAEMDRLQACRDELDEELVENMKQLDMALTDPRVPADVKQLIMDGCKHTLGLSADLHCGNIKKSSHRRRSASADE